MGLIFGKPVENFNRRDSFDRVCDDITEVIFQYLSLKNKLRLECVSKQFQRTIFRNQLEIEFKLFLMYVRNRFWRYQVFNYKSLISVLKKCPNIEYINLWGISNINEIPLDDDPQNKSTTLYNQVIELVINNCNRLKLIQDIDFELLTEETIVRFVTKFDTKIELTIYYEKLPQLLHTFHSISFHNITLKKLNAKKVTNIKKLWLIVYEGHYYCLNKLVLNKELLTHLNLNIDRDSNDECLKHLLITISTFNSLIHLSFTDSLITEFGFNEKPLAEELKLIADKCTKLKSIGICYAKNFSNVEEFLLSLKAFKRLKRLDLKVILGTNSSVVKNTDFSFKELKGLSDAITELTLTLKNQRIHGLMTEYSAVNETILDGIDINLPKLKRLEIDNKLKPNHVFNESLSRHSSLKSIKWI